jgi:hypothetical protein
MPLVAAGFFAVDAVGGVEVQRPAAHRYRVRVQPLLDQVLLAQHIIALKAAAFALAGDVPHPFQREGFGFGEFARILDMIPDAVHDFPQLPLDFLGIVNGIQPPAVLDPPQAAAVFARIEAAIARNLRDVVQRKTGRDEFHRAARVFAVKVQ